MKQKYVFLELAAVFFVCLSFSNSIRAQQLNTLVIHSQQGVIGEYEMVLSQQDAYQTLEIQGDLKLAVDAIDPINDACSEIVNDLNGFVASIERGACSFLDKVYAAEEEEAIAVIICNNK